MGNGTADAVEVSGRAALGEGDDPGGEVAHVDHLGDVRGTPGASTSPPSASRAGQ